MRPRLLLGIVVLLSGCVDWPAPRSAALAVDADTCYGGDPQLLQARLADIRVAYASLRSSGLADCQPGLDRRLGDTISRAGQAFHGELNAALASDVHTLELLIHAASQNLHQLAPSGCAAAAGNANGQTGIVPQARWTTEIDETLETLLP